MCGVLLKPPRPGGWWTCALLTGLPVMCFLGLRGLVFNVDCPIVRAIWMKLMLKLCRDHGNPIADDDVERLELLGRTLAEHMDVQRRAVAKETALSLIHI